MVGILGILSRSVLAAVLALTILGPVNTAQAKRFTTLYTFKGKGDGASPKAGLLADNAGNLYGTAESGGKGTHCGGYPCGVIFKLSPDGTETVLHYFKGKDGASPVASLIADSLGNLYGTTYAGGRTRLCDGFGCGVVFRLATDGTETVLYAFKGGKDGANPVANLVADNAGNLYGTTEQGGGTGCYGAGCGTVFELAADGKETVLHKFEGGNDGALPLAGLILDGAGNLYGTTSGGGGNVCYGNGCGTVFKLAADGTETVLHSFNDDGTDGILPQYGSLIADQAGNLYGTTYQGGAGLYSGGTVFKIAPDGSETILYAFSGENDGGNPYGGLVTDDAGNFYGTTASGGGPDGDGVVFKLAPDGTETVKYAFQDRRDGYGPYATPILVAGYLYGTEPNGGKHFRGTIFKLRN